jgi:glycosyltransferase involved in cell wall biosynthesis
MNVSVSVVVPSRNEGAYVGLTVDNLLAGLPADGEVVVVDDGSTDGSVDVLHGDSRVRVLQTASVGPARARNAGAEAARGSVLVFSDAHVEAPNGWLEPLLAPLRSPEVGATGPVLADMFVREAKGHGLRFCDSGSSLAWLPLAGSDPYPVPALAGFFLAMRHEVFDALGGFDPGMLTYGMEDPEICLHLWSRGYQCVLVPSVEVAHLYRRPVPEYQLEWETGLHNILRLGTVHFGCRRLTEVIRRHRSDPAFAAAAQRVLTGDAALRRDQIDRHRVHSDEWLFDRFQMNDEPVGPPSVGGQ